MFSQNQEESIIKHFFESPAGNIKPGTLLDIGANDGQTLSNSRALILKGWSGVLVEPDPLAFKKLHKLYGDIPTVGCYQAAIGNETGDFEFHSTGDHLGRGDTGLLSTLKETELARFPGTVVSKTEVKVYKWSDFYALPSVRNIKFKFISIDAEGMDLDILKQINFIDTETVLVCVEWNSKDRHLYDQVMYPFGFRIIHLNGENIIYGR